MVALVNTTIELENSCGYLTTSRIESNGDDGIQAGNNVTVNVYDTDIAGNTGHGIAAYNHAFVQAFQDVGSSITGNEKHGINVWNGVSVQIHNVTITGNSDGDVNASFGSRLNLEGGTVGTISCDDSVLSGGDWVCPVTDE